MTFTLTNAPILTKTSRTIYADNSIKLDNKLSHDIRVDVKIKDKKIVVRIYE